MPDWHAHIRRVLPDVSDDPARAEEIVAELVQHLDDRYKQSLADGATEAEARDHALAELTGAHGLIDEIGRLSPSRTIQRAPPTAGGHAMSGIWQDWRHAWRLLWRDPWFTLIGVATLALGIGANGAIFSVVHAVLLRPLPYADPYELVMIWESRPREGVTNNVVSPADFLDWRIRQQAFDDIGAQQSVALTLTGMGDPERVDAGNVSASFFRVLGVVPSLGRDFGPDEEQAGRNHVVILNHGFWQRRFASNPNVVGTRITLSGELFEVIGVLPSSFRFPDEAIELWYPIDFTNEDMRARFNHFLRVYGRLRDDVTITRAQQDMDAISAQLQSEVELQNQGHGAHVVPLRDQLVGDVQRSLVILMAAVTFILLIACVNVANLLLVRGATRRKEVALRAALGAGRGRIVRQFALECITLAGVAALAALPVTMWATRALKLAIPTDIPRLNDAGLNLTVVGFMAGAAVLTAILFSLAPAWQVARLNLANAINDAGANASSRRGTRNTLVVSEIALAFVLLVGAGLMTRSLINLLTIDAGFVGENVLTVPIALPRTEGATAQEQNVRLTELLENVASQAGVQSVGYTSHIPMSGNDSRTGIGIEGREPDPNDAARAHWRVVTPGYFSAMQIRLVAGRFPTDAEAQNRSPVAVINRTAAERYWPGLDPIGRRLRILTPEWREIIAVVDDVRHWGASNPVNPEVYLPGLRNPTNLVVRGGDNALALTATIREQVLRLSPDQPVASISTVNEIRAQSVASPRFYVLLLATFAVVALVLALIGVYGLVSYSVAQSRRDIGIRMAIGASGKDIVRMFVREGIVLTVFGLFLGIAGGVALTRLMSTLLFGVTPTDLATFTAMALFMGGVAILASYLPARDSARVDPLLALRHE